MKTIIKTAQIGGKGSMRRKIHKRKKNNNTKITFVQSKLLKLITQVNNFNIKSENINKFNQYCFTFIENHLTKFTKKFFYKKQIIENKQGFIEDILLKKTNIRWEFFLDLSQLSLYLSPKGQDSLLDCYYNLWDNLNEKKYIK